jgi:hypothetical protein
MRDSVLLAFHLGSLQAMVLIADGSRDAASIWHDAVNEGVYLDVCQQQRGGRIDSHAALHRHGAPRQRRMFSVTVLFSSLSARRAFTTGVSDGRSAELKAQLPANPLTPPDVARQKQGDQ